MKIKIIELVACVLLLSTLFSTAIAMNPNFMQNENKETILPGEDGVLDGNFIRYFILGRISDIFIENNHSSFVMNNVVVAARSVNGPTNMHYFIHMRSEDQRFYINDLNYFQGILTSKFIFGIYTYQEVIPEPPPEIILSADYDAGTLTVLSVAPSDIKWEDLDISDEDGLIVRPDKEYVESGDKIIGLDGLVTITYMPTDIVIGMWDFP